MEVVTKSQQTKYLLKVVVKYNETVFYCYSCRIVSFSKRGTAVFKCEADRYLFASSLILCLWKESVSAFDVTTLSYIWRLTLPREIAKATVVDDLLRMHCGPVVAEFQIWHNIMTLSEETSDVPKAHDILRIEFGKARFVELQKELFLEYNGETIFTLHPDNATLSYPFLVTRTHGKIETIEFDNCGLQNTAYLSNRIVRSLAEFVDFRKTEIVHLPMANSREEEPHNSALYTVSCVNNLAVSRHAKGLIFTASVQEIHICKLGQVFALQQGQPNAAEILYVITDSLGCLKVTISSEVNSLVNAVALIALDVLREKKLSLTELDQYKHYPFEKFEYFWHDLLEQFDQVQYASVLFELLGDLKTEILTFALRARLKEITIAAALYMRSLDDSEFTSVRSVINRFVKMLKELHSWEATRIVYQRICLLSRELGDELLSFWRQYNILAFYELGGSVCEFDAVPQLAIGEYFSDDGDVDL